MSTYKNNSVTKCNLKTMSSCKKFQKKLQSVQKSVRSYIENTMSLPLISCLSFLYNIPNNFKKSLNEVFILKKKKCENA
jgi:hypothetical protein